MSLNSIQPIICNKKSQSQSHRVDRPLRLLKPMDSAQINGKYMSFHNSRRCIMKCSQELTESVISGRSTLIGCSTYTTGCALVSRLYHVLTTDQSASATLGAVVARIPIRSSSISVGIGRYPYLFPSIA